MWISRNPRRVPAVLLGVVTVLTGLVTAGTAHAASTTYGADWQMNETAGPMLDSSGNGNNSSIIEAGVSRDGAVYHFARGRVIVPSRPSTTPGSRDFTISARLHLESTTGGENWVQKNTYSLHGQQIKIENSGKHLHCRVAGSLGVASVWGFNKAPVLMNGFHTVSCSKTATAVQLRLDGRLLHQQLINVGNVRTTARWSIGGKDPCLHPNKPEPAGCDFLQGSMDWVTLTYP
jgi:hypothetical protein